jgi:DNA-binding MarR family transcriptional regulator
VEQALDEVNAYLKVSAVDLIERRCKAQDESTTTTSLTTRPRDLIERYVEEMADRLALRQAGLEGNNTVLDSLESREELEE